jgi:hypothetical protein
MKLGFKKTGSTGSPQVNRGFALLFSVLISSLLLTIGLSIFSIALKELAISTAARQSIHAFFAADSGRERALYEDLKNGVLTSSDDAPVIEGDNAGPYFHVIIQKNGYETILDAYGYDSTGDDRVERAITQTY